MKIYIITIHRWVQEYHTYADGILRVYKNLDDAINYLSWPCDLGDEDIQLTDGYADFETEDGTRYTLSENVLE